jgi:hypothetical protein
LIGDPILTLSPVGKIRAGDALRSYRLRETSWSFPFLLHLIIQACKSFRLNPALVVAFPDPRLLEGDCIPTTIRPWREKRRQSRCGTLAEIWQLKIRELTAVWIHLRRTGKTLLCGDLGESLLTGKRKTFSSNVGIQNRKSSGVGWVSTSNRDFAVLNAPEFVVLQPEKSVSCISAAAANRSRARLLE